MSATDKTDSPLSKIFTLVEKIKGAARKDHIVKIDTLITNGKSDIEVKVIKQESLENENKHL